jgi:tetratricopeptide (TPR) repeat protein
MLDLETQNHILYSNRAAVYLQLGRNQEALEDAQKAIDISPDWSKVLTLIQGNHLLFIKYTT